MPGIAHAIALLLAAIPSSAFGQTTADEDALRQRQRNDDAERRQRETEPAVHTRAPIEEDSDELPAETPCFTIHEIQVDGAEQGFGWVQRFVRRYEGRCIGEQGVNRIARRLTQRILGRGKATTRVGIPEQNLAGGTLRLVLAVGTLSRVTYADDKGPRTRWQTAIPMRPGDVIDVADLDQGLEQLKRMPSQDVKILLRPGDGTGKSDLELDVKRTRPWRLALSLDDGGARSTGRMQGSLTAALDDPLTLNDLLSIAAQHDADLRPKEHATWGLNGAYSVPWGYWTFGASGGTSRYRQKVVTGSEPILYSGRNTNVDVSIARVVHRDQASKTTLSLDLGKRWGQTWLDDVEIEIQRREVTSATLGAEHRQSIASATLEARAAVRRGLPWWAQRDPAKAEAGAPTTRPTLYTASLSLSAPFRALGLAWRWRSELKGQYSDDHLLVTDQFAIGGRYTVRGFDGDSTLAAERGLSVRDELGATLPRVKQELYIAVDHGRVAGPSAAKLAGKSLTGAALGVRGGFRAVSWDAFVGLPLARPHGFETARPALGFSVTAQY